MNNSQLAHVWANNPNKDGKGSNMFVRDGVIYSYGTHFPIARHYKGVVLFTSRSYSVSTSKHKSYVRHACSHLTVFEVVNVLNDPSGADVRDYSKQLAELAIAVSRARDPKWPLAQLEQATNRANLFCEKFGFKTRFSLPDESKLAEYREKSKQASAKKAKATIARNARIEEENKIAIAEWLAGTRQSLPYTIQKVYLRKIVRENVEPCGQAVELQTSKGALVDLNEAHKAFRFIIARKEKGWHRNGETFVIGDFHLDAVNEQGIVAGCHRITWDEIERFAALQGW
jgi:hypothetical protein